MLDRTVTTQETVTAPEAPATLGQRLRQARVGAGLTQSELAESRFSKQYVSQIERDRLRPGDETLRWLADRVGVDPQYLATGVDGRERERLESLVVRGEAALEAHDYAEAISLLGGVADALPPGPLPLPDDLRDDRDGPLHRGPGARGAVRHPVRPAALAHLRLALPLLPQAEGLGGRAGGRRAGARARGGPRRPACDGGCVLPGSPRRRAAGAVARGPQLRGAGEAPLRGDRGPRQHRQAPDDARRAHVPARERRRVRALLQAGLRGRARGGERCRRGAGRVVPRAGASPHRRGRARRGAGAARARASRRSRGLHRRDRKRPACPRPLPAGAGAPRGSRGEVPGGRGELRAALVRKPQGGGVDRTGRARGRARREGSSDPPLPARRRGAPGLPLLGKEVSEHVSRASLQILLVTVALLVASMIGIGFPDGP